MMRSDQLLAIRAKKLAKGLLEIAELAMPDTYLATDSRVQYARETLKMFKRRKLNQQQEKKNHGNT